MTLKIKVCGMRHPANIEDLVKLNPDYIGFIFYPKSGRYIGTHIPGEISEVIPSSIQKAGVFVDEPVESVAEKIRSSNLDIVQLHGAELPEYCKKLKKMSIRVIKAFSISPDFEFSTVMQYDKVCDFYLFDTAGDLRGGTGLKFNWEKLNHYNGDTPFFLSGGIKPEDALTIKEVKHPQFLSVDLNSGFEIKPGLKDIVKLKTFMDEIRGINSNPS